MCGGAGREGEVRPSSPVPAGGYIENPGVVGPKSRSFLRELGKRMTAEMGEALETTYLMQRLSVVVQRRNAAALACSVGHYT